MKGARWFSSWRLRVRTLLQKNSVEAELRAEMKFHLEQLVAGGMKVRDALRTVRRKIHVEREMEKCRDERAWQGWERLKADVVFGWRQLRKRKMTTAAAVLSLGLAMGSSMAAFRLVDALFLRPLPIAHPERLYELQYHGVDEVGRPNVDDSNDYPQFVAMRAAVKGQAELIADSDEGQTDLNITGDAETEKVELQDVSGRLFTAFGLRPAAGRLLNEEDDRAAGASPYAVISYDYWTRRFGRDQHVVGRTFRMYNNVYAIVGVAPKGFSGMEPGEMADVFEPLTMDPSMKDQDSQWFRVYADVQPGVQMEALRSKLDAGPPAFPAGGLEGSEQAPAKSFQADRGELPELEGSASKGKPWCF